MQMFLKGNFGNIMLCFYGNDGGVFFDEIIV